MDIAHETDVELLRQKALCLLQENDRLSKKVVELLRENLSLKGMSPGQLQTALALLDDELNRARANTPERLPSSERRAPPAEPKERKPHPGHGPKAQPNLPIVPELHDLDQADKTCPECGGQLVEWLGQEDETEEIDIVERRFVIKKKKRPKYRCRCGHVEMADMPARLIPGGRYSNDFAVEVATGKFADHLPLDRQSRIMAREGLDVDSQTLWDQVMALAKRLEPAWQRLRAVAILSAVLGFDETRWEVLTKGSASKKSWAMWQLSTRTIVYFEIAPGHDSEAGKKFLDGFSGIAIGDAATVHKSMVKGASFRLAFCWSHYPETSIIPSA